MAAGTAGVQGNPFAGLTRKHGIKCESLFGVKIDTYVEAFSTIVASENIIAASRANGSVIVFLDSLKTVEEICLIGLTVSDCFIHIEPLVKPATKVVLSGVPPFIPNGLIEDELKRYGRVVSTIRIIPLGCRNPQLKHVKSFRRQVYMICDQEQLDGVINIVHEGRTYRIYLSTDEITCYKCHKKGHIMRNCRENTQLSIADTNTAGDSSQTDHTLPIDQNDHIDQNTNINSPTNMLTDGIDTSVLNTPDQNDKIQNENNPINTSETRTSGEPSDKNKQTATRSTDSHANEPIKSIVKDKTNVAPLIQTGVSMEIDHTATNTREPVTPIDSPHADKSENETIIVEETVLTPPSGPVLDTGPCISFSNPGELKDVLPIDVFDKQPVGDMEDTESISSDVSDMSQSMTDDFSADKTELLPHDSLVSFLDSSYNSKKIVEHATQFCPNLRLLIRSLNHLRKDTEMPSREKIRIQRMTARLGKYYMKMNKEHTEEEIDETPTDEILNIKRGLPARRGRKPEKGK